MSLRVLVVDDQALVREGLTTLLSAATDIEPVGAAANGEEAVQLAAELTPDVILMDLRMPVLDGVEATRQIKTAQPEVEIVVLTTHADDESIMSALTAGARGYLTKDAGIAEIARAIHAAAAHQVLLDPVVQTRLLAAAAGSGAPSPVTPGVTGEEGPVSQTGQNQSASVPDDLTPRELEVLSLIAQGLSNAEISARLFVSAATVKTHVNHVFSKIGARDRAQAVHYAYSHGLVST